MLFTAQVSTICSASSEMKDGEEIVLPMLDLLFFSEALRLPRTARSKILCMFASSSCSFFLLSLLLFKHIAQSACIVLSLSTAAIETDLSVALQPLPTPSVMTDADPGPRFDPEPSDFL